MYPQLLQTCARRKLHTCLIRRSWCWILLIFLCVHPALSQDTATDSAKQAELIQKVATMQDIIESIASLNQELDDKETEYNAAETEEAQQLISEQIKELHERLAKLDKDFTILSTGIDQETFFEDKQKELKWEEEVQDIFSPLLYELKEITSRPREIERLRNSIPYYERRVGQIELALSNLDTLNNHNKDQEIDGRLEELSEFWDSHRQEHQSELETMQLQLDNLERKKKTFGEALRDVSRLFFRSRGKNLLMAIGIFFLTFLILRYIHKLVHRYTKIKRKRKRRFFLRIVDILYYLFTLIASVGLFLSVLYLSSDWVLLGLSIVLILGVIWAGKNALPSFFEQMKLLLDFGTVREGERVMYNGIPWLVQSLNIYTELYNPELDGGLIRLPIKDMIGLRSRPFIEEEEPWFPTTKGDWINLSDGFYGKVFIQTPEFVGINTQRGSYKTYRTNDFLSYRPQNLSRNFFSVNRTVRIDYKYRHQVNREIAPKMKAFFEEAVKQEPYGHLLVQVIVELRYLDSSALGIICILKFKGDTASEYFEIGWKIEQIALEALNHLKIEIPYPHLAIVNQEEMTHHLPSNGGIS
ncbi:MAG: hypothetical protein AAF587_26160 [Bacteroidota bacterium]